MRVGIIGLPLSGKSTLFEILAGAVPGQDPFRARIGVARVPDMRVDQLSAMFGPRKTTHAQLEFLDLPPPREPGGEARACGFPPALVASMRTADAHALVLGCFDPARPATPGQDLERLVSELVIADLLVAAGRVERMEGDRKRGGRLEEREYAAVARAARILDGGRPLWSEAFTPDERAHLKGYAFLTQRPVVVVANLDDASFRTPPPALGAALGAIEGGAHPCVACVHPDGSTGSLVTLRLSAGLEAEIATLDSPSDRQDFLADLGITQPARDRVVQACFRALDLISFFTVGDDEVKAWTVERATPARRAAGKIHTDLEKGFIRAEVVRFEDLVAAGSLAEAKAKALLRLEGKDYPVADGDVMTVRFAL